MYQLIFLFPPPADVDQFEADFAAYLVLFHEKAGIPAGSKPYTVTRFMPTPDGALVFYLMLTLHFETPEALDAAAESPYMQELAPDTFRISTGGVPAILMGTAE